MDKCSEFTEEEMVRLRGREAECGCEHDLSKYVELGVHTKLEQELADLKYEYSHYREYAENLKAEHEKLKQMVGELERKYRENSNKELSMCHSDLAVQILDELKQAIGEE